MQSATSGFTFHTWSPHLPPPPCAPHNTPYIYGTTATPPQASDRAQGLCVGAPSRLLGRRPGPRTPSARRAPVPMRSLRALPRGTAGPKNAPKTKAAAVLGPPRTSADRRQVIAVGHRPPRRWLTRPLRF